MPHPDEAISEELFRAREEVQRLREVINRLTPPLETLLKRRGFRVHTKDPVEDLVLPAPQSINAYYALLRKYSFRFFLRDVIKHQDLFTLPDVAKYAAAGVTESYIEALLPMGLLERREGGYALAKRPVTSFGPTLEWYFSEVLRREFGAEAAWGVKFRKRAGGGDYDVLAKVDGSLLYAEVKSSPPKQIYDSEIAAFLDRRDDLAPELAVFFMDTELRMKDKIVSLFEAALAAKQPEPPPVMRIERELFHIGSRIFIVNAKEDIARNLARVFSAFYRRSE